MGILTIKNTIISVLLVIFLLVSLSYAEQGKRDMIFIANENFPLPSPLTASQIKSIYSGALRVESGIKLFPVDQKDKDIFEDFLSNYIGSSSTTYKNYWVKKLFSDGSKSPKVAGSAEEVARFVSENPGGIGYIWKDTYDTNVKGLKVIDVTK